MQKRKRGSAGVWICVLVLTIFCSMVSLADTKPTKPGASPARKGSWEVRGTWIQDEHGYQFSDDKGRQYEDEWLQFQTNWYYIGLDSYMVKGWIQDGENWYYLKPDGTMHKGWMEYDGGLYYFSDVSGEMRTTGYLKRGNKEYKFANDGTTAALVRSTGENRINDWYYDGTGWIYINPDWTCVTGRWLTQNGKWYYFDIYGYMQTGWLQLSSGRYYLGADGVMFANTTQIVDGITYIFGADGKIQ